MRSEAPAAAESGNTTGRQNLQSTTIPLPLTQLTSSPPFLVMYSLPEHGSQCQP